MMKRPTSVTVVCWIMIVSSLIALVHLPWSLTDPMRKELLTKLMGQSPIPIPLQHLLFFGLLLINVVSGAAMLRGKNWGRLLFVGSLVLGWIVGLAISPVTTVSSALGMVPRLILFIVVTVILFRPQANQYFSAGSRQNGQVSVLREVTWRKVINVVCYVVAGTFIVLACELAFIKSDFDLFKFVMIGGMILFALVPLLLGLWLSGFHKWKYYMGIVLLSVAGIETFQMFSRVFMVAPSEVEAYLPPGTRDPFTDYFTGIICILVLSLAGGFLTWSGRKFGLDQKGEQGSFEDKEATGSRSIGNGGKAVENLQSAPRTQTEGHLSVRGASIIGFSPESSARKAGMHKGDVIIEYSSERDITIEKLSAVTAKKGSDGGQVRVAFVRNGQQYSRMLPSGPLGISVLNTTINVPLQSK